MALKENDFVEIDYTGILDDGTVFDTTDQKTAVEAELADEKSTVQPAIICLGKNQIIPGIDKNLIGKDVGSYEFDVPPEDGFGKKDAKKIELINTAKFRQANITPQPGLSVEVDDRIGTIRAVTGGRTIVDFNHPLSGRKLKYKVEVKRVVTDKAEQVKAVVKSLFNLDSEASVAEGKATVKFEQDLPDQLLEFLKAQITDMTGLKEVIIEKNKKKADMKADKKGVE